MARRPEPPRLDREGRLTAPETAAIVKDRLLPQPILFRYRVWQRRPVSCGGFPRRAGVPDRHAHVEVARVVRLVGLGRELVDGGGVDGVLALLRALGVAVVAAPLAEEVARQPLAICASAATAFCDLCGPAAPAGPRAPVEAILARVGRGPVALDCDLVPAALMGALSQSGLEPGGRDEARRELATPPGDEG